MSACLPARPLVRISLRARRVCTHVFLLLENKHFSIRGRVDTTVSRFRSIFGKLAWVA